MARIGNLALLFLSAVFMSCLEGHYCYIETEDEEIRAQIHALDRFVEANFMTKQPSPSQPPFNASEFPNFQIFQELGSTGQDKLQVAGICSACNVGIGFVMFQIRDLKMSEPDIEKKIVFMCNFSQMALSEVCTGLIRRYSPTIYYIIQQRPKLTSKAFCGVMFQSYGCATTDPYLEWTVDIPETRNSSRKRLNSKQITETRADRIKIAQLSDLHVDPSYKAGTDTECDNKILCCRDGLNASRQAGKFGDGGVCDSPYSTFELALEDMAKRHADMKLFYMTGDIIPHNIWKTEKDENIQIIKDTAQIILKYFPKMKIIPVLGNHETHPVNFYSPHEVPENLSTTWIYDSSYEAYKQWIPQDQKDIYLKYGYYAVEVTPKFRLLVINSNFCYGFNVWQMYEGRDPGNQLDWLIKELLKSEVKQQTVHIVGHVPPTHDECSRVWSRNFYNIMLRFHHVVTGQFYGHTHFDEWKLLYNKENKPMNALWICPSLTPYHVHNFAYRIYYAAPTDYQILDHDTWMFDLKKANKNPEVSPTWEKYYRATKAYGIPDVKPNSLGKLMKTLAKDDSLFQQFYQHYHKILGDEDRKSCSTICKKHLLCGFVKSYYGEDKDCVSRLYT